MGVSTLGEMKCPHVGDGVSIRTCVHIYSHTDPGWV